MEELADILQTINIPTNELCMEIIQDVLLKAKNNCTTATSYQLIWNQVSERLWLHLHTGLNKFEDQLMCATAFYTVLNLTDKHAFYLDEVLSLINYELALKQTDNMDNSKTSLAVSLMYGCFQSTFLIQDNHRDISNLGLLLQSVFKLLLLMAYEYSRFTFIVFKIINSFKKVTNTDLEEFIFSEGNKVKLLNLTNHNWENPITGVRDMNKNIFQTLISLIDESMYKTIFEEINSFYWNKAKYLMLSEFIEQSKKAVTILMHENNWINGLMYSLHKPGLVSAGADMYFAILKKLKCEKEWCEIFLSDVMKVLNESPSSKSTENFKNYWCLTSFKRFPLLFNLLIEELDEPNCDMEKKLHSTLCIIKQANKLGLVHKNWTDLSEPEKIVLRGLEHCDNHVRMLAFDIVCVSHGKRMPTKLEYELVLSFLRNNINSDCTILRLSMLNSFHSFLIQFHNISFLNDVKNNIDGDKENLQEFCRDFQELVVSSIDLKGNYQRKVTCIKLAKTFLNSLNKIPRKRQKSKTNKTTMFEILGNKQQWVLLQELFIFKLLDLLKDPADDLREIVIELLLDHYSPELRRKHFIDNLIESALTNMKSKFFYYISCGKSMFKLVINILLKETHEEAIFKSVEDIFYFAHKELISEYKLNRSIVQSIQNGKQLHSFMSIINTVLDVCFTNSYEIKIPSTTTIELLDVLDGISNQFVWEQESSTNSNFAQISDMVENIIVQSGHNNCIDVNDETKISGLHQMVLNCLWLNVKATCDLSSLLIKFQKREGQEIFEKYLHVITNVLETCRHKGAIEAAGVALGQSIRHLTLLPKGSDVSKLPYILLKKKLSELMSEASKMSSVTRRGAGFSIMVHRIVSSDMKKGKPLFHCFMNTLLEACNNAEYSPSKRLDNAQPNDNEKDLPNAIYIHFLTRIVTDSSLASDTMYYSAKLAELAFNNLTSPHWQIRNAALQLYGALVPKLIGQKKVSGTDEETIATVACDEFRTHSPKLWKYIQAQIKDNNYKDKVQHHSNLVPILSMLANIARRYTLSFDAEEQKKQDTDLLKSLVLLLDSPIHTVKRLTARCIFNIYTIEVIYNNILGQQFASENFLHGCLILISNCHKVYYSNDLYKTYFSNLKSKFSKILNVGQHSYVCKELFEDVFYDVILEVNQLQQTLLEMDCNDHAPGVFLWADARVRNFVNLMSWDMYPQMMQMILNRKDYEHYCEYLINRIETDNAIKKQVLIEVVDVLMSFEEKFNSCLIWKILYIISLKIDLSKHVDIINIVKYLEKKDLTYKLRYIIPFLARLSVSNEDETSQRYVSKIVYDLTDYETTDVDMRYIAVMANNELGTGFNHLPNVVKITSLKSAVILLQDEDEEVRNASVYFYKNVNSAKFAPHPYICLFKILNYTYLQTFLRQSEIEDLHNDLDKLLLKISSRNNTTDQYNPFANDSKNIYLEGEVFRQLIKKISNK